MEAPANERLPQSDHRAAGAIAHAGPVWLTAALPRDSDAAEARMLRCTAVSVLEQARAHGFAQARFRGFDLCAQRLTGPPGATACLQITLRRDGVVLLSERFAVLAAAPQAFDAA